MSVSNENVATDVTLYKTTGSIDLKYSNNNDNRQSVISIKIIIK